MDNAQPVAKGEYNLFQSRIVCHLLIEATQGNGLWVAVVGGVYDVPVPQCVIRQQPPANRQYRGAVGSFGKQQIKVGAVLTLVCVHLHQIEFLLLLCYKYLRITYLRLYLPTEGRK